MYKNLRKNKGITLVALIVTIIILLILAGISIASLTGNGLFEKAKLAKEKSEESQVKENNILGEYYNAINGEIFGNRDGITDAQYEDIIARLTELEKKGTKTLYSGTWVGTQGSEIQLSEAVENFDIILVMGNRDDYYTTTAYMPAYMNDRQKTVINLSNSNDGFYVGFKATGTKLTVTQVTGTCGIVAVYGIKL